MVVVVAPQSCGRRDGRECLSIHCSENRDLGQKLSQFSELVFFLAVIKHHNRQHLGEGKCY